MLRVTSYESQGMGQKSWEMGASYRMRQDTWSLQEVPKQAMARWIWNGSLCAWLFLVLLFSAQALAQSSSTSTPLRVFHNVQASPVSRFFLNIAAGETVTFQTTQTTSGADPVLRLWDNQAKKEVAAAVYGGTGLNASLTYTSPAGGNYTLIIHAHNTASVGPNDVTDIQKNGQAFALQIPIYGVTISQQWSGTNTFATGHFPTGSKDTELYLIGCDGKLKAWDDDAGAGLMAQATASDICHVIVGSAYPGATHLYVNDAVVGVKNTAIDGDGDGLGRLLEAQLGTCDPLNKGVLGAWKSYCDETHNPHDSDRDGLSDYEELLGNGTLLLPQWGADPLQKDVFVHVPRMKSEIATNPFTDNPSGAEQFARVVRSVYITGKSYILRNPNGKHGIRVHMNLGLEPTDPQLAKEGLYGQWGGALSLTHTALENRCKQTGISSRKHCEEYMDCRESGGKCFSKVRNVAKNEFLAADWLGRMHLALAISGSGGGNGDQPGNDFHFGATSLYKKSPLAFAHELGHNLGLDHPGHKDWGDVQCKPHYVSIMNYAYSYRDEPLGPGTSPQFSHGVYASATLNPADVKEYQGLASIDPAFLSYGPFAFFFSGLNVDWNRDGNTNTYYKYRAPLTFPADRIGCGSISYKAHTLELSDTNGELTGTPVLRRSGNYLYAFFIKNGVLSYQRAPLATGAGLGLKSGCTGNPFLSSSDKCLSWESIQAIPLGKTVQRFAIVRFQDRWVLAFSTPTARIYTTYSQPNTDNALWIATSWTSQKVLDWGLFPQEALVIRGPELASLPVDPNKFGGNTHALALIWLDSASKEFRWHTKTNILDNWTYRGALMQADDTKIKGLETAALSDRGCGAFVAEDSLTHIYCYNPSTSRWDNYTSDWWKKWTPQVATAKPAFVFRQLRYGDNGDTQPVSGSVVTPGRGQFWLIIRDNSGIPHTYISNVALLDGSSQSTKLSDVSFVQRDYSESKWAKLYKDSGASLFDDGSAMLAGMKGIWLRTRKGQFQLDFLPFADGVFHAYLKDGDDFKVMELGVCLGLRSGDKTYCASKDPSKNQYVGHWNLGL